MRYTVSLPDKSIMIIPQYTFPELLTKHLKKDLITPLVLEAIGDGVSIQSTDFRILYQNDAQRKSMGSQIGNYCYEVYEKKETVCEGCPMAASFSDGKAHTAVRTAPVGGKTKYFEITSSPIKDSEDNIIAGIEIVRDITDRRKAEEALLEESCRAKKYLDIAGVMIAVLDASGTVTLVNQKGCEILGCKEEDIVGKNWFKHFLPERIKDQIFGVFLKLMAEDVAPVEYYENPVMRKDGVERIIAFHNSTMKDPSGKITGIVFSGEDITERKRLEEQLLHSQKMKSIGTLAGGVAHDFNNILTAIIGFSAILKRRIPDSDPLRTFVDQIQAASNNATTLTRGLLTFSRKQKGHPVPVNLNDLVRTQKRLLLRIIGEDIEFKTTLSDSSLIVKADPNQMEQVLMNLVANARDAMPEGGRLTVSTNSISLDETFTRLHGFGTPGEYALISISDTGTGIDSTIIKRIFEPFFTSKAVNRGTGLGLSIVYGIIKQHNGYINVDSESGHGTTFRIYLPLISPAENIPAETGEHVFGTLGGTETILVAEDDDAVRDLLISVLTEFGYKVIAAGDGEEAVTLFMENRDSIRLVVTDVIMPKKNGRTVYKEIKEVRPDIKAIFLSGYSEEIIRREDILETGMNLISKPVNPNVFLTKIREMLDGKF